MKSSSYTEFAKIDTMAEHETKGFSIVFEEYSDAGLRVTVTNKVTSEKREISIEDLWKLLPNNKVKGGS